MIRRDAAIKRLSCSSGKMSGMFQYWLMFRTDALWRSSCTSTSSLIVRISSYTWGPSIYSSVKIFAIGLSTNEIGYLLHPCEAILFGTFQMQKQRMIVGMANNAFFQFNSLNRNKIAGKKRIK